MKMKKPMIGVVPLVDEERESYWMLPGYMKGIEQAGGIPVMLPLTSDEATVSQLVQALDGFLFTGGHDVSPAVYGEEALAECGVPCPERDRMEEKLFLEALRWDKPAFGICRGIQFMNAILGGTLYQDLPTQHGSAVEHHQRPPYDIPVHWVRLCGQTPLHRLLGTEKLHVNSYHHQAVKSLSGKLKEMAVSEDGLIEAVYMPGQKFVWAVQWHPEFAFEKDEASRKILRAFVAAAEKGGSDKEEER